MNLEIRSTGVELTHQLRQQTEERLQSTLERFGDIVRWTRVQFTDENGPKGGVDIRCTIQASLAVGGEAVVHETHLNPGLALGKALEALRTAIRRRVQRARDHRRGQNLAS